MSDIELENQEERKAYRRKRRIRNQILAYMVTACFGFAVIFGIVFGIGQIRKAAVAAPETGQNLQSQVDEFLKTESIINIPNTVEDILPELSYEERLDQLIDTVLENMPLEDKVAGLFIVAPEAITKGETVVEAGESLKNALMDYAVGGLVYHEKNMRDSAPPEQLIKGAESYSRYALFSAVLEEGGKNGELVKSGIIETRESSATTIGKSGDTNKAYEAGQRIGQKLDSLGIHLDFAPCADLASVENSAVAYNSYGSDVTQVPLYAQAMMKGLKENSVIPCVTHFPGNGGTTQDTATGMATTDRTAEELRMNEIAVFKEMINAGAPMIMVGHIAAPSLTGDKTPCSLSSVVVTDILRNELGFQGVIISDALNKKAISEYYDSGEACVRAIKSGCDMLLEPEDFLKGYAAVLDAVVNGTIAEERINDSLRRIYRIKYADKLEQ